jgi:signal transduction histidine kinase
MDQKKINPITRDNPDHGKRPTSSYLASRILSWAGRGLSTGDFLAEVSRMLIGFTGCSATEIRVIRRNKMVYCVTLPGAKPAAHVEIKSGRYDDAGMLIPRLDVDSDLEVICEEIARGRFDPSLPFFTADGGFSIDDANDPLELSSETCKWAGGRTLHIRGDFRSLAVIPFLAEENDHCLLLLKSSQQGFFTKDKMVYYEELARILGISLTQLRAQVALRERVKELTCLYGIAQVAAEPGIFLAQILESAVWLLPPGWLYPDIASARIIIDGQVYSTPGFQKCIQKQTAEIVINGEKRGAVEVAYTEVMPELDKGPFLKEERSLIDAIARELAQIIERKQAEEDKENLRKQLLHADRLATIGQLAAGVAHELNEPLGSILGFAQLLEKDEQLGDQAKQDIRKIITASLHTREVINKLMLFARESPPRRDRVNVSQMVQEGLYFWESRCAKAGVKLKRILAPDLPELTADAGQLLQVLINLTVNAIQAMPDGGELIIRTEWHDPCIRLVVEDTGIGMSKDIQDKVFIPFFTTKDVNEGTGLGLAVVQGIVSAHGGSVSVVSEVGKGTRFEVLLPVKKIDQTHKQDDGKDVKT